MTRDVRVIGKPLAPELAVRVAATVQLDTLEEILHWGYAQRPPCDVIAVIVQDEYTHDVIVRGPAQAYLCFDTT